MIDKGGRRGPQADSVVALVDAASAVEREVIGDWIAQGGLDREIDSTAPVTQLDLDAKAITNASSAGRTTRWSCRSGCCGCRPNATVCAG